MSAPGNAAKLGTAHSNIQTAQSCLTLVGIEPTRYALVSTLVSQRISPWFIEYLYQEPLKLYSLNTSVIFDSVSLDRSVYVTS